MKKLYFILFLIYCIINLNFFSYSKLSDSLATQYLIKLVNYIPVLYFIFNYLFYNKNQKKYYLNFSIRLTILSFIIGVFNSFIFWDQSFTDSLVAINNYFPYFLYFVLISKNYSIITIKNITLILFWITIFVFVIDILTFPDTLFAWRSEERENRASLGIIFFGQGFTILGSLFYLEKYFISKKIFYLVPYILALVFIILLTGSRTYFVGLALASMLIIYYYSFLSKRKGSNFTRFIIILLLFFSIGFLQDRFFNLINLTSTQINSYNTDIRYQCIQNYIVKEQQSIYTSIFGNGVPYYNSIYGKILIEDNTKGFFLSDIGIFAIWFYWGIFAVIAWFFIFYKVFKSKFSDGRLFLFGFFVYLLINSFFSYTLFDPGYILSIVFALYLSNSVLTNKDEALKLFI